MSFIFFFNDTATTEIYTLSLHDALPISYQEGAQKTSAARNSPGRRSGATYPGTSSRSGRPAEAASAASSVEIERSEEHTSELQSRQYLVCRLLLEKKKNI